MHTHKIASLDSARFDRLEAERDAIAGKLAAADAKLSAFCRRYSDTHGFCVTLSREQVRRDLGRGR
jgi:hypothetical protein